jgi:hypothetical protein
MNEDDLARRVVDGLDSRLAELPAFAEERLAKSREAAIARYRERARTGWTGAAADWLRGLALVHRAAVRMVVPAMFVVAATSGVFYWQTLSHQDGLEFEAALLADELPIHAYTDPGFDAWLQNAAYEQ